MISNRFVILTGLYVYAETSKPRVQGERAVLMSPRLTGPYCLRFHFHMLGATMGSLKVYKNSVSSNTEVFSISGNQGDRWYMAQTPLTGPEQFQVITKCLFSVLTRIWFVLFENQVYLPAENPASDKQEVNYHGNGNDNVSKQRVKRLATNCVLHREAFLPSLSVSRLFSFT